MSQPAAYAPVTSFLTYQSTQPWFPGQNIDVELSNLKTTTDQIRANIALIQRDDGALANGIVTTASLSTVLQTGGFSPLSGWLTGTAYTQYQTVVSSSSIYQCATAHTSVNFATDLAAGKWTLIAALPPGPAGSLSIGTVTNGGVGVASATITGAVPNQALNLALPQGVTGATGPAAWSTVTAWLTATPYVVGPPASVVTQGGESYVCLISHTSGTFATDLAAGKWIKLGAAGGVTTFNSRTGTVLPQESDYDAFYVRYDAAQTLTSAQQDQVRADIGASGRNRLINGAMRVDKRNAGASQTLTAAASVAYTVDRWYASCTGANVAGQQVAGPTGYEKCYQFTGAASVTGILFGQRIRAANCVDLVNQSVSIRANISNSLLTTVTWTAYSANAADNFSAKTQISTGTWTVSSTATEYTATFSGGANAANGIAIELSVGAQTSGTWKVTAVQLERSAQATPYEYQPIGFEVARCGEYYTTTYDIGTAVAAATHSGMTGGAGFISATLLSKVFVQFPAPMRTTPTLSYWDGAGNASKLSSLAATTAGISTWTDNVAAGTAPGNLCQRGFHLDAPASAGWYFLHYAASAEL